MIDFVRCLGWYLKMRYLDRLCALYAWRFQRRTGLKLRPADEAARRAYSRALLIDSTDEAAALTAARRAFCSELKRRCDVTFIRPVAVERSALQRGAPSSEAARRELSGKPGDGGPKIVAGLDKAIAR